jgi:hypothetical protein
MEKVATAPDDLNWLLDRADKLASDRNNAIHAPCSLYLRGDGSSEVMAAVRSANAGNRRAKDLEGEDLLTELHWCAAYALRLGQFAGMLAPAMASPDHYEWPARPKKSISGGRLRSKPQTTGLRHDRNHASLGVTRSQRLRLRRRHGHCGIAVKSGRSPARRGTVRGLPTGGVGQEQIAQIAQVRREYDATEPLRLLAFGDRRAAHAGSAARWAHLV